MYYSLVISASEITSMTLEHYLTDVDKDLETTSTNNTVIKLAQVSVSKSEKLVQCDSYQMHTYVLCMYIMFTVVINRIENSQAFICRD